MLHFVRIIRLVHAEPLLLGCRRSDLILAGVRIGLLNFQGLAWHNFFQAAGASLARA